VLHRLFNSIEKNKIPKKLYLQVLLLFDNIIK